MHDKQKAVPYITMVSGDGLTITFSRDILAKVGDKIKGYFANVGEPDADYFVQNINKITK